VISSIGPAADTEADLQIQRRQSDAHLMRAIEDALTPDQPGFIRRFAKVCKQPIFESAARSRPHGPRVCRDCKEERDPQLRRGWFDAENLKLGRSRRRL